MPFQIEYAGKTIDLPKGPAKRAFTVRVSQPLASTPKVYRDGAVLRELEPRTDIHFSCRFPNLSPQHYAADSLESVRALRVQLENFWVYLLRSEGPVSVAVDSTRRVRTTLNADRAAGSGDLAVDSAAGVVAGRRYRLFGSDAAGEANRYQMLTVTGVAGGVLTVEDALDYDFSDGAHVLDEFWFPAVVLREQDPPWPFVDHGELEGWFDFALTFFLGPLE